MLTSTKKDVILDTATSLFAEYGYHAVGIDRIIAESNTAKMTLYKYFPSKENLIENVLQRRDEQLRSSIMAAVDAKKLSDKKLKAIFDWYENWFKMPDFHGCMFIKATEEFSDAALLIRKISQDHKSWLKNLLQTLLKEMKVSAPEAMASHIVVILDGLTVASNMFRESEQNQVRIAWRYVNSLIAAR